MKDFYGVPPVSCRNNCALLLHVASVVLQLEVESCSVSSPFVALCCGLAHQNVVHFVNLTACL